MSIPRIPTYSLEGIAQSARNRTQWELDPKRAILLIHDMQNYFVNFYDAKQSPIPEILANISSLKQFCKAQGIPVVYTAQPGDQRPEDRALLTDFWGKGLADQQEIVSVIEDIKPDADDTLLTKWRYSAFQRTGLHQRMKETGRNQLIICGIYAHIGILATTLEAFMTDIQTFVVADAVADFSRQEHEMALHYISGRCGQVCETLELTQSAPLTKERMLQDVLQTLMLDAGEIQCSDNLMYAGLDSLQLMNLVAKWEKEVPGLSFSMLAEVTTIDEWHAIIQEFQGARPSQREPHPLLANSL
jgi:bifunctional isochorismate lyase/aryl carrier protein